MEAEELNCEVHSDSNLEVDAASQYNDDGNSSDCNNDVKDNPDNRAAEDGSPIFLEGAFFYLVEHIWIFN